MTTAKKAHALSEEQKMEIEDVLRNMALDGSYNTEPSYSANSDKYPDNLIPFVDKHMAYLRNHPMTDPQHYLSNLRLITRVR